jgi:hypothetical protein
MVNRRNSIIKYFVSTINFIAIFVLIFIFDVYHLSKLNKQKRYGKKRYGMSVYREKACKTCRVG